MWLVKAITAKLDFHHDEAAHMKKEITREKKKIESLKSLDCFVMDNSIRESTVGQFTRDTHWRISSNIYEEVKKCGFKHVIVASFAHMTRVDDSFLEETSEKTRRYDHALFIL